MKKYLIIIISTAAFGLVSCNNNYKNPNENPDGLSETINPEEPKTLEEETIRSESSCYRYESSKDTIHLKFDRTQDEVSGTLSYNYLEKPKSEGTLKGKIIGDTIFADYTFNSPEEKGVREVIFIKKDSTLIEGFGETEDVKGKTKFKQDAILSFNAVMSLDQMDCD